jgi:hypothetical protein
MSAMIAARHFTSHHAVSGWTLVVVISEPRANFAQLHLREPSQRTDVRHSTLGLFVLERIGLARASSECTTAKFLRGQVWKAVSEAMTPEEHSLPVFGQVSLGYVAHKSRSRARHMSTFPAAASL